jgi:hypothetical protein
VQTRPAVSADLVLPASIHAALAEKDLLSGDRLLDAGYVDGALLVSSRTEYGDRLEARFSHLGRRCHLGAATLG